MPSIFVQIPAYRDFELPKTIKDAVTRASGNNTIIFGVHNCVLFDGEVSVNHVDAEIKIVQSIAPQNIGLQKARKIANQFYDGEDFYLQIDSHMRFVADWDELLIENMNFYKSAGIRKPLITMYPGMYRYQDDGVEEILYLENWKPNTMCFCKDATQFAKTLIPSQTATTAQDGCMFTYSVSGAFIFADGSFSEITPNEKIAFWGEEPLIAARAFTHGYDIVMPMQETLFHLYNSQLSFSKIRRHSAWTDFPKEWGELYETSQAEYKSIFMENIIGGESLGRERTLKEFMDFTGLNFHEKTINCWLHKTTN